MLANSKVAGAPLNTAAMPSKRVLETSPVHCDDEAEDYDDMIRRYAWLLNKPFAKMVSGVGLEHGKVLDVGTGPGWIPIQLALQHPGWEIWGVDASPDMVALATRHAAEAQVGDRVHFMVGDATNLPFDTGHFDLSVSHFMLHHMERPEQLFNEMARVTRGGGKIVIKDLRRQSRWKYTMLLAFSKYVLRYGPQLLKMYEESLGAALTVEEVRAQLKRSRLSMAQVQGFRGLDFVITA